MSTFRVGHDLIAEATAGRAQNATVARAVLLARAIAASVPSALRALRALASALANPHGALVSMLWSEFERETESDTFRREMTDIAAGLLGA